MRTFILIFLVSAFLTQNVSKLIIVLNYQINKEYIAKNLCVNRDKPKSCCEGKCELKKQLDEEDKKESLPTNNTKEKAEVLFVSSAKKVNFSLFPTLFFICDNYLHSNSSDNSRLIYHPPKA